MDLVKYCPKCGLKNKGNRNNCKSCGEDLSSVMKVQDGNVPKDTPKSPEKKKICPVCFTVNSAKSVACPCGADLGSVPAIPADKVEEELKKLQSAKDTEEQSPSKPPEPEQPSSQGKAVRLCSNLDCNYINPVTSRLCEKCHAPTNIMSRQEAEAEILKRSQEAPEPQPSNHNPENVKAPEPQVKHKAAYARLLSDDGTYSYEVKPGKIIVGRQNVMNEHLQSMVWVSRKHAEINFSDGVMTVQDLGSQNHTYVNGRKVRNGEVRELSDGDILSLGDSKKDSSGNNAAFFRVELR
ncbi:MAG: FHA domain-containing protein [Synergistaceae bacterium]|nr:FHA domain-containing protein [Synergistaceae bacterium]